MKQQVVVDKQAELDNCTFIKTILMMLVVLDHSIAFWTGNWFTRNPVFSAEALPVLSKWLNTVHIYGFALVSGYLFYFIKYERGGYQKFVPFVASKAKRLLIPYACMALVWVIPIGYLFFRSDVMAIIKNYVLAMAPGQLWFLVMLFDVFVIFWPLADFFKKHDFVGAVSVIGIYGIGVVGGSAAPDVFKIWTALRYVPLFWLGFKLRQHGTTIIRKIPSILWIAASILLFVLVRYLGGVDMFAAKLLNLGLSFLLNVVGALMAFVVLQNIADKVNWNNQYFAFLSKRSMVVYLLHQQIIYFFIYWLNGVVNPYLHAGINFIGALTVSLLLATVLMKFRFTRFLVGEK